MSTEFKAVLVGINKYPGSGELRGCVNDVLVMRDILRAKHAVREQDVRMVVDERATKANILSRLEWLIDQSHNTKNLFFQYSGHGAQVPDQDYDDRECDGMDEVLCPVDFDWRRKVWITDDEIHAVLQTKHPECRLVMVFDCCHSGTVFRSGNSPSDSIYKVKPRSLDMPVDLLSRVPAFTSEAAIDTTGHGDRFWGFEAPAVVDKPVIKDKAVNDLVNTVVVSGCEDYQTSADAWFHNRFQGALTYCMQKFVYNNPDMSVRELKESTHRYLKSFGFSQNPQFSIGKNTNTKRFIFSS